MCACIDMCMGASVTDKKKYAHVLDNVQIEVIKKNGLIKPCYSNMKKNFSFIFQVAH